MAAVLLTGIVMALGTTTTRGYTEVGGALVSLPPERTYPGMFYLLAIMLVFLIVDGLTMPKRLQALAKRQTSENFPAGSVSSS